MEQLRAYFRESFDELMHKVSWPTWPNLQSTTTVVLVATFMLSFLIFLMDFISKQGLSLVYGVNG